MLPDVIRVVPEWHRDSRGYFIETWRADEYADAGMGTPFVQENLSYSVKGTLRGIHYQIERPQGRLVRVVDGAVFDVAVDLRQSSPTFGQWIGETLSATNRLSIWIPPGFAHGFFVTGASAEMVYRCTDYYAPQHERTLLWNDPDVAIEWPSFGPGQPVLSAKDAGGDRLKDVDIYA